MYLPEGKDKAKFPHSMVAKTGKHAVPPARYGGDHGPES